MPLLKWVACVAVLLGRCDAAHAWTSPAPDVVVYCTPALEAAMLRGGAAFRAATGVEVHVFVAPPDGLIGLIKHRARDDVVVADAATIGVLAAGRQVRADSVIALGRNPFVLIGRRNTVWPGGATAAQLIAAFPTVRPDPTTAASFDGASILRQVAQPLREIGVSDTPGVIAEVRVDAGMLGLVHRTEAAEPGIAEAAPLQVAPTPVSGALVTMGQSGEAGPFLAMLAGPAGQGLLRQAGLEPAS